jgi:hypothetical protein
LRHREEEPRLVERLAQPLVIPELRLDSILFLQDRLRGFGVIPEFGLAGLFEQFFRARGKCRDVKDASRARRCGIRNRSIVAASRQVSRDNNPFAGVLSPVPLF